MSTSEPAPISYDVLWQNIVSNCRTSLYVLISTSNKISTLAPLASLRISSLRIKHITGGQVIVGGFGDVEQAKLRTLFGPEPVVALKKLRPSGDREQRIRVLAVGFSSCARRQTLMLLNCVVLSQRTRRLEQA